MSNSENVPWAPTRPDLIQENLELRREVERLRNRAANLGRMEDELARIHAMCPGADPRMEAPEAVAYTIGRFQGRIEALEGRLAVAERQLRPSQEAS